MANIAMREMRGGVSVVQPRLDEKPWGGRRLARFGLELPPDMAIGEALVTADDAMIVSGAAAGQSLGAVVAARPELLGEAASAAVHNRTIFPLLVKLIDASENLSIQVHPDDAQAASSDRLGKTEAWHVLAAEPNAMLYIGLRDGVSLDAFRDAASRLDGSSAGLLRQLSAQPGATVLLPAGTVHALGAGVMVYEIQQPSDITYRLDDWGRTDAQGNAREMHLDAGFAVMQPASRPKLEAPVDPDARDGRWRLLVSTRQFALERIALPAGGRAPLPVASGPQVVTILAGRGAVGPARLDTGHSAVVWPGGEETTLVAEQAVMALRGWVPENAS